MDFWDLTKLLIRRWYLTTPLLLLSVAAVVATALSVKPDYSATGHVQLVPPAVTPDAADKAGRARNPWADLGPDALGEAVMIRVRKEKALKDLVAAGYTDNFTVSMQGRSPIISIEAVGRTPRQAAGTVAEVAKLIDQEVTAQQRVYNMPRTESITTLTLDDGGNVEPVRSKLKRALIVVAGLGMLLTAALTVGVDALLRRPTRKRAAAAAKPVPGYDEMTQLIRLPLPRTGSGVTSRPADVVEDYLEPAPPVRRVPGAAAPPHGPNGSSDQPAGQGPPGASISDDAVIVLSVPKAERAPKESEGKRR